MVQDLEGHTHIICNTPDQKVEVAPLSLVQEIEHLMLCLRAQTPNRLDFQGQKCAGTIVKLSTINLSGLTTATILQRITDAMKGPVTAFENLLVIEGKCLQGVAVAQGPDLLSATQAGGLGIVTPVILWTTGP